MHGRVGFRLRLVLEESDGPAVGDLQSVGLSSRKVDSTTQHLIVSALNNYFFQKT